MSRGGGGVVVELLGPPASGKSTLAARLAAVPGVTVVKDHHRGDTAALVFSALRSRRTLLAAPPPAVSRLRWAAWTGRVTAAPAIARARLSAGAGTVVLDQGPVYTLGRMADLRRSTAGAPWWAARVTDCARLLDLLVVLDADLTTLATRLRSRNKPHRAASYGDAQAAAYLAREQATCRLLAESVAAAGGAVLRLDTTTASADTLLEAVIRALPGRGGPHGDGREGNRS